MGGNEVWSKINIDFSDVISFYFILFYFIYREVVIRKGLFLLGDKVVDSM